MKFALFPLDPEASMYAKEIYNILALNEYERVLDMNYKATVEDRVSGYTGYLTCVIDNRDVTTREVPIYDPATNMTLRVDFDNFAELLERMMD